MDALEQAITEALANEGVNQQANKAYLEFIKANFIVPIERNDDASEPEVLFLEDQGHAFLPVFTNPAYLEKWASGISERIQLLKLSGVDLLKGIGNDVYVCLNIGSEHYKEFNPAELARMRSMVLKFFK